MKKRNLIIGLSAIASLTILTIPIVTLVSCSKNNNNPTENISQPEYIILKNNCLEKIKSELQNQVSIVSEPNLLGVSLKVAISNLNNYFAKNLKLQLAIKNIIPLKQVSDNNHYKYKFKIEFDKDVKLQNSTIFEQIKNEQNNLKDIQSLFTLSTNIIDIQDNLDSYNKDLIDNSSITQFKPNIEPFQLPSNDPNNSMYDSWFEKINSKILLSDFIYFLRNSKQLTIQNNRSSYNQILEKDLVIFLNKPNITINNLNDVSFTLNFILMNNTTENIKYYLNETTSFYLKSKEKVNVLLKAQNIQLSRLFYEKLSPDHKTKTLLANYEFSNITLLINKQEQRIKNFKLFDNFSRSLNNIELDISNGVGYLDIYQDATEKLKHNLTIDNIKSDISNMINGYIDFIKTNVINIEPIIKDLAKNTLGIQFISNNAKNFDNLMKLWISKINPNYEFISDLVIPIIKNRNLADTINDQQFKIGLKGLLSVLELDPKLESIIGALVNINEPISQDEIMKLIDLVIPFIDQIDSPYKEDIKTILQDLKTINILDVVIKNSSTIWKIISSLLPNLPPELVSMIDTLINVAKEDYPNKGILDVLIDLKNTKVDSNVANSPNLIYTLLKSLIPPNQNSIIELISTILLNNPKITVQNLQNLLKVFAFPIVTKPDKSTSNNYSDFIDSLTISNDTWLDVQTFDAKTSLLNLTFAKRITFGADIQFNNVLLSLLAVLPNNIPGLPSQLSSVIELLPSQLPNSFKLFKNDYFEFKLNFTNSLVQFDINNKKQLSWQAVSNNSFDINFPNSVKYLYDESPWSSLLAKHLPSIINPIFFQNFKKQNIFKPHTSLTLNKFKYENYDPNKKNNNAILINKITSEEMQKLTTEFNNSITNTNIGNPFKIAKPLFQSEITIQKFESNLNFNIDSWKDKLFNLANYVSLSIVPYYITLNYQKVINSASILGLANVPEVNLKSITINTYFNVYDLDTNQMVNSWTISLK